MKILFWLTLNLILLTKTTASQSTVAVVRGRVYTQMGMPLADAKVEAFPLNAAYGGPMPGTRTDVHGDYVLRVPFLGNVQITAYKQSEGFPNATYALLAARGQTLPVLELTPEKGTYELDIHLSKSSCVVTGHVIDATTRKPVPLARITIRKSFDPGAMISSSISSLGEFSFPLPAEPMKVEVTAIGYNAWFYKGATGRSTLLPDCQKGMSITAELTRLAKTE